jgi:2-polyprenyl-6-hydroxyphenyl methylase/3-demethylubiquinone-9 3-methyltransferase
MNHNTKTDHSTVDSAEIRHFDAMAESWWSPRGDMRTLHMINPVRLAFIRDVACRHFKRDPRQLDCLKGLRFLDIGCGGGILSEPLARIGAAMVGADPSVPNIEVARRHAADSGVEVDCRPVLAEELADAGERFDVVLAMEVVEHVADVSLFVKRCAEMVKPGGLMIAATINRTMKSWAFAIVGAEYILRLLPLGTHHWDKFVTPAELEAVMAQHGLDVIDERGVTFNVLSRELRLSNDMDVNYMLVAERRA